MRRRPETKQNDICMERTWCELYNDLDERPCEPATRTLLRNSNKEEHVGSCFSHLDVKPSRSQI